MASDYAQSDTLRKVGRKGEEEAKQNGCWTSSEPVKFSTPSVFKNLARSNKLSTLEDCLKAFGMFPRLLQLDESLKEVRRCRKSAEEHEMECELFDKELQELLREYHPDRVMQGGGTEEEMTRAKNLGMAFNATRWVLKTLTNMFLEDIDMEHKYKFYSKLDISLLGNKDEVEMHAHQVLFKINLTTEMKLKTIIVNLRRFLFAAQNSVTQFLFGFFFKEERELASFCLGLCVTEYRKLCAEHEKAEIQCRNEKLHIYTKIHKMKRDSSVQLRHLEALLELWRRPFGESFPLYSSTLPVDDYFVLPFVCYTSVILVCSVMDKLTSEENKKGSWFRLPSFVSSLLGKSPNSIVDFDVGDFDNVSVLYGDHEDIVLLYKLALCYGGNRKCSRSVRERFGWRHTSKDIVQRQFLETLKNVQVDLENRFKFDDYVVKNARILCFNGAMEMTETVQEIGKKTKMLEMDIQRIKKNNELMKQRLDEVLEE